MRTEIKSVAELVEATVDFHLQIKCPPWWRGHADSSWNLTPSIFREKRSKRAEPSMLGLFVNSSKGRSTDLPAPNDYGGWLTLARHYGLPTRLLDWSENALIALYFAVMPPDSREAAVWGLNPNLLNRRQTGEGGIYLPNVPKIADLFKGAFSRKPATKLKVAAFLPHTADLRVLLQHSRFTIHDDRTPLEKVVPHKDTLCRFTIPAGAKRRLAIELEALGFRRSLLFPDLTTLADEIAALNFRDG